MEGAPDRPGISPTIRRIITTKNRPKARRNAGLPCPTPEADRDPSSGVFAARFSAGATRYTAQRGAVPVRPGRLCGPANRTQGHTLLQRPPRSYAVPHPKIPMSEKECLDLVDKLRYLVIDVLESGRGSLVAALVFLAVWGLLAVWFLGWGVVLGWIPAAVLAIPIGYACC